MSLAHRQDLGHRPGDIRVIVVARVAHLYREIAGTYVQHVNAGRADDLLDVFVAQTGLDVDDEGRLLVLLGHPCGPVIGLNVVAVAVAGGAGQGARRRERQGAI